MTTIKVPGPLDPVKLGQDWIDDGTLPRTRFEPAGPVRGEALDVPSHSTAGGDPAQTACLALESMIRSTIAICRIAGESSSQCEDACDSVRDRVNQLSSTCKLTLPAIAFKEHRATGTACGTNATLGVGKYGLTNAAELVFYVNPYARCYFSQYAVRRTIEEKLYEEVGGAWRVLKMTPAGTDDSPSPRTDHPACMQPPDLHSFDSPGFPFNVRELSIGDGKKVSSSATRVEIRMNFLEWIAAEGPRVRIQSDQIKWNNVLKLKWSGTSWKIEPGSAIALSHVTLERS
jgi:hypothetical protein